MATFIPTAVRTSNLTGEPQFIFLKKITNIKDKLGGAYVAYERYRKCIQSFSSELTYLHGTGSENSGCIHVTQEGDRWWVLVNTVRSEVFTAVTMKNAVFWDVTPCCSCKNRNLAPQSSG
jgi:hypothetical protein